MKVNIDKSIVRLILVLLSTKFLFSYLNVKFGWWQRDLVAYTERYNFLRIPTSYDKQVEFVIIPLIFIYVLKNHRYFKNSLILVSIFLVMIGLNICTSLYNSVSLISSIEYTFKIYSPILLFIVLVAHHNKYNYELKKILKFFITSCFILALIGYIFLEKSYNHDKLWLPIYFSSVHTHSYIMVISAIGFSYLLYENKKFLTFFIFCGAFFIFMYFAHRVRTTLVLFLIYLIFTSITIHYFFKIIWIKLLVFIPIFILIFLLVSQDFDLNQYSSGRLVMYEAKYEMLKGYNSIEYFVGRGKGSDFINTDYWIRAEKNSHNDVLTFLVENGIPYTLLFLLTLFLLAIQKGKFKFIFSGIILGYLATSFLSNGLSIRPLASYLLFLVLAYIYSKVNARKTESDTLIVE